jgi:hypothetical protein
VFFYCLLNIIEHLDTLQIEELYIHFDLNGDIHEIPINQSIITDECIKLIVEQINQNIFEWKLKIEIFIYPPIEWSHLRKYWFMIASWVGLIIWSIAPDLVNWLVMGLWDWREVKEYVRDWTVYMKDLVIGFLSKDNNELKNNSIDYHTYYKAFEAKNKFYIAAISNEKTRGIWFDNSQEFPISRDGFNLRIVNLNDELEDVPPVDKYHELTVVSPINTVEDKDLCWQVKDKRRNSKRFSVYMKDDGFYELYLSQLFSLKTLLVKVRYIIKRNEDWDLQVIRKEIISVYKYNNTQLFPLPQGVEISRAEWQIDWYVEDNISDIPCPVQTSFF